MAVHNRWSSLVSLRGIVIVFFGLGMLASDVSESGEVTWGQGEVAPIEDIDAFLETCPSEAELTILRQDFRIFTKGQSELAEQRPYRCSEPVSAMPEDQLSDRLSVYQALRVTRHMKLNRPLPWTTRSPYDWLKSRIDGVSLRDDSGPFCCYNPVEDPDAVSIVLPTRAPELLKSYTQFIDPRNGVGLVHLILLIFHEARHVDKPHNCDTCKVGSGCDTNLSFMGAWAIQAYLAYALANGEIEVGLAGSERASYYQRELDYQVDRILELRLCEASDLSELLEATPEDEGETANDQDGDGVPDEDDFCPNYPGSPDKDGC